MSAMWGPTQNELMRGPETRRINSKGNRTAGTVTTTTKVVFCYKKSSLEVFQAAPISLADFLLRDQTEKEVFRFPSDTAMRRMMNYKKILHNDTVGYSNTLVCIIML